jgi:hypothetical protein
MKAYKKTKIAKITTYRKEYKIVTNDKIKEPYWDEGINFYPRYRKGYKNSGKQIMSYQVRMYKTCKHNRKTQWKK